MTREEAIEILADMPISTMGGRTFTEMADALDLAVKSLKNEPLFLAHSDGTIETIKKGQTMTKYRITFNNGTRLDFSYPDKIDLHRIAGDIPLIFNNTWINMSEVLVMEALEGENGD